MERPKLLFLDKDPALGSRLATFAGVKRYADARGWDARIVMRPRNDRASVVAALAGFPAVAGCVVECSDDGDAPSPRLFGRVPVVLVNPIPSRYGGKAVKMGVDHASVARAAFRELSAGRPAGFAAVDDRIPRHWARARVAAFAAACREKGEPCTVIRAYTRDAGAAEDAVAAALRALPRKTALFAVNDHVARRTARAARRAGFGIPRDFTLVGVDNDARLCEEEEPTLTSIQVDLERLGFLAARWIGESVGGGTPTAVPETPAVLPTWTIRRDSTSGRGRRAPFVAEAVETIRREACSGLSAATLAARFPVSRNLFDLRFREATGHSPLDEILHVRLEKACTLLAKTGVAVSAVPSLCGFRCDRTCDALFRSRFGLCMSDWRKKNSL